MSKTASAQILVIGIGGGPGMRYAMWAHNLSLEPQQPDTHNLLGLQLTALAAVLVAVSMTLNDVG